MPPRKTVHRPARARQTHGRIEHPINERLSIVWDATEIRPEVRRVFAAALERAIKANRETLARYGLGPKSHGRPAEVTLGDGGSELFFD